MVGGVGRSLSASESRLPHTQRLGMAHPPTSRGSYPAPDCRELRVLSVSSSDIKLAMHRETCFCNTVSKHVLRNKFHCVGGDVFRVSVLSETCFARRSMLLSGETSFKKSNTPTNESTEICHVTFTVHELWLWIWICMPVQCVHSVGLHHVSLSSLTRFGYAPCSFRFRSTSVAHTFLGFLDFHWCCLNTRTVIVVSAQAMTASSSESMFVPHRFGRKLDSRVYIMVFQNKFLQLVSVCMETLFKNLVSRNMFQKQVSPCMASLRMGLDPYEEVIQVAAKQSMVCVE